MRKIKNYLQELYELATYQSKELENENIEGFGDIGDKRECIIGQMKIECSEEMPLEEDEVALLEKINMLDKKNAIKLNELMDEVKLEIKRLSEYNRRDRKYIDNYPDLASGRYFDR